jgi:hypothetical protein
MFNSVHSLVIRHLVIPSLPSHHSPFTIPGHHIHTVGPLQREKKKRMGQVFCLLSVLKGLGHKKNLNKLTKMDSSRVN